MKKLQIDNTTQLSIENVCLVAEKQQHVALSTKAEYQALLQSSHDYVTECSHNGVAIYGVTTGYGDSCDTSVAAGLLKQLPVNLYRFLGCGSGDVLSANICRAILFARIRSLANGVSGVRYTLLEAMVDLLAKDIIPVIPSQGSVGASGDLVPLSYIAAVLAGERKVYFQGKIRPTDDVFAQLNIKPITFEPKETLAIVNGTAAMTGIACLAYGRTVQIAHFAHFVTALSALALDGNIEHFDEHYFSYKPHPGQNNSASAIAKLMRDSKMPAVPTRMQDRYSIRCAPHILGVLQDALTWFRAPIETELNSANDNPLIDGQARRIMHGGHFYGGHIAFCMDALKTAVANIADLLDRQIALLVDPKFNQNLPPNLSGASATSLPICHGFKGLQIAASSLTSEALKLTMPASAFSRSTECHNQDKVSLGTIAARDCLTIVELTERVLASAILVSVQAVELRLKQRQSSTGHLRGELGSFISNIRQHSTFLQEDRELQADLLAVQHYIQSSAPV